MLITTTTATLLLMVFATMLPTPATSVAIDTSETSGNTSISESVSFKKPQGLFSTAASSTSSSTATTTPTHAMDATTNPTATTVTTTPKVLLPSLALSPSSSLSSSPTSTTSSIFAWGHVTKYASILFDKDVVVKGPIVLDVKYPEIANSNSYTIIGILVYDYDGDTVDMTTEVDTTANANMQVYPVMGGIGYNSTIIRISLLSDEELHYKVVIHGVDI